MERWLSTVEELSSALRRPEFSSSAHIQQFTAPVTPVPPDLMPPSGLCTDIHAHINKNKLCCTILHLVIYPDPEQVWWLVAGDSLCGGGLQAARCTWSPHYPAQAILGIPTPSHDQWKFQHNLRANLLSRLPDLSSCPLSVTSVSLYVSGGNSFFACCHSDPCGEVSLGLSL